MKTLIFFGSARKEGNTKEMVNIFIDELQGDVEVIDAYRSTISPCIDCRYCWHKRGCSIKDDMQSIYKKIDEADNIVFASPMYFYNVPSPLKIIIDRLQVYWAGVLRKDRPELGAKKGAILMCGGARPFKNQFIAGEIVLKAVLKDLSAECLGIVTSSYTDKFPVSQNEDIKNLIRDLAKKINTTLI
ncbi:flavodoxin family protein [Clostridium thailandense]|uniref:flavodoxin family protein n=1 Tax=Clostridium thailandense TaxID=2794346 RepID=UPI003989CD90